MPKTKSEPNNGVLKYINTRIKKLHSNKSRLVTQLFKTQQQSNNTDTIIRIKCYIKIINTELHKEFNDSVTKYYETLHSSINYRRSDTFFPKINRIFYRKAPLKIGDIHIKDNDPDINALNSLNEADRINNSLIIRDPVDKLNIIGKHLEKINAPKNTNQYSQTKREIDETGEQYRYKLNHRLMIITTFSDQNRASHPCCANDCTPEVKSLYSLFTNNLRISSLLKTLKNKSSSGPDNIPPVVLKHIPQNIINDITVIFNNAINNAYYPTRWKEAKVLPLHKKGKDPKDKASYRPISLTNSISTLFQKIIKDSIHGHIYGNNIIPPNQFGFRPKHSTVHAVNKFLSDTNNYLHKGKSVGAVLIDLEKAFDSVWHNGLIYKLKHFEFQDHLILLILDIITGATFTTWDERNCSCQKFNIIEGVPQGTVTSPVLFIIFNAVILNLFELNSGNQTHSIAYADDLILYAAGQSPTEINNTLNKLTNQINNYYIDWNLKINPTKSEYIIFRKTVNEISFKRVKELKQLKLIITDPRTLTETEIPQKKTVKYLGVQLDHLLRLNNHHSLQLEKAKTAFRAHHRLFHSKSLEIRAKIICYLLLIRPILTYAAPILWNTGPTVIEKKRKFERTCLRTCLRMYRSSKSDYKERISNKIIYNTANIPRIDNFSLDLTRNYFSTLPLTPNPLMKALKPPEGIDFQRTARNGYIPPEAFTTFDKLGLIQDQWNIPHLYHKQRHQTNKAISLNLNDYLPINRTYSTTIPLIDYNSKKRLSKHFWWLENAMFINELKNRPALRICRQPPG